MKIGKQLWKLKFRALQVQSFFKLGYYNVLKKLRLEGDDGLYFHLQRDLMRYTLHADPEEEYLAEHGLLPDPQPEPEPESEAPAPEPGLVQTLSMFELMFSAVSHGETTYMATEVKEYRDHVTLTLSRVDEDGEVTEHEITQPHRAGEPYVDFSVNDLPLRFDFQARKLHLLPLKE